MIILLKLIDIFHGIWRAKRDSSSQVQIKRLFYKPSDNLQRRDNVISMLLHKYEACWRRIDLFDVGVTWRILTKITTQFWHRDAGGIEVRVYTCEFICRFHRFLTSYVPPLMTRTLVRGLLLNGKNPRWVMIFFFKNWLPLKMVVKTTIEVASL